MPLIIFIALLSFFSSCEILGIDEDNESLDPGPRNYEWTVDSVGGAPDMWVGWANTIWGSAPNDVWIGLSGGYYNLWHYDGETWSPWPYREGPDGFTGSFYSIYGFAQDDVWMGGGDGELWHFDGSTWKLFYTYNPEGLGGPNIFDIWGTSPSDIYAVGTVSTGLDNPSYKGFILHYDGRRWRELLVTDFGMQFNRIRKENRGIYLSGSGPYSYQTISDSVSLYILNNKSLNVLYSKSRKEASSVNLNKFGNRIYFVIENEVTDKYFNSILPFTLSEDVYHVNGRHEKDMFITSEDGIAHYNGEDIQLLVNDVVQPSAVLFEKDVFFFANDYVEGTNLIYHGTLTKKD
ncbi:hypothetical protein SAMN06265219_10698 [Gracilimonas mengyeensis]|uniref:Uncharacterized protein n=2 Tax=Gracilimonas mengyeensis TaxID=1302730 RepID=A0A521CRK1_9BACT|nr:hypothetical protein SAMN06265219_10698 [Gracilimonas mengyeensis]